MALIIKGDMPKGCGFCWECLGGGSGAYYCNRAKKHISDVVPPYDRGMEWCPIVGEIPDSHGRLIDEVKLRERAYAIQRRDRISFTDALAMALIEAETIVEANNGN